MGEPAISRKIIPGGTGIRALLGGIICTVIATALVIYVYLSIDRLISGT